MWLCHKSAATVVAEDVTTSTERTRPAAKPSVSVTSLPNLLSTRRAEGAASLREAAEKAGPVDGQPNTAGVVSFPSLPKAVEFTPGTFMNPQGIKLKTFRWGLRGATYKGIVWLCHGYGGHTIFEWFMPAMPGQPHNQWDSSVPKGFVEAGYLVCTLDHQSHGHSEGARGLRCFVERGFDDFTNEAIANLISVSQEPALSSLPIFLFGVSMGGATAVRMAQTMPSMFRGMVLYSPMLSLEEVKKQKLVAGIRNRHLAPLVDSLNRLCPTLPIGKAARNTIHPECQTEFDEDPFTYSQDCRVRVAKAFQDVTNWFLAGGLRELRTPFITFHSVKDTFTDPLGSQTLLEMAEVEDKTYLKVGLGQDVDVDIWHALNAEPGHEEVFNSALAWIQQRSKP